MAAEGNALALVATVLAVAFVPSLVFLAWVRKAERHEREPWRAVLRAFLWGATFAVFFALLGEGLLLGYQDSDLRRPEELKGVFDLPQKFFLVLVVAPLVEETMKAWGLRRSKGEMNEVEDGLVYGAAIGLGFAATENLFYEVEALLTEGEAAFWATAAVRSISATFLHASTVAIVGYGYARALVARRPAPWLWALPGFALAIALHAGFNALALTSEVWALVAVVLFAVLLMAVVRGRIRHLDRRVIY